MNEMSLETAEAISRILSIDVNALMKQFTEMGTLMKRMSGLGPMERMSAMRDIARTSDPSGAFKVSKQRSKRGPLDEKKLKDGKKKKKKDAKKSRKKNR